MSSAFIESVADGSARISLGETVVAEIRLLFPQDFVGRIEPGIPFELCDGRKVIARGTITAINNYPV